MRTNFAGLLEAIIQSGVSLEDVDRKLSEAGKTGLLERAVMVNAHHVVPILVKTLECTKRHLLGAIQHTRNHPEIAKTLMRHMSENASIPKDEGNAPGCCSERRESRRGLFPPRIRTESGRPRRNYHYSRQKGSHRGGKSVFKYCGKRSTVQWGAILSIATKTGNEELVNFLFEAAADDQRQSLSDIPDEVVRTAADTDILRLLLKNMRKGPSVLMGQILSQKSKLGKYGANPLLYEIPRWGFSPTELAEALVSHLSCYNCGPNMAIITTLLDAGADVNLNGGKPLAQASKRGRPDLVKLFLEKGSGFKDGKLNKSFLINVFPFLCVKSKKSGYVEIKADAIGILRHLLKAGADLNANPD
ncbi:hypothetical protein HK102_001981 [Quaeritorhiza haematococci]|nr:hypothetical protein HK102_001981 [Quaeritorhiza haematococci]